MPPRKAAFTGTPALSGTGTVVQGLTRPDAGAVNAFCREAWDSRSSRSDPIHSTSTHTRERDRGILIQSGNFPFHISVLYKHAAP